MKPVTYIDFPDEAGLTIEAAPKEPPASERDSKTESGSRAMDSATNPTSSPAASLVLRYEDGCCLNLRSDSVPLLPYSKNEIPLDARRLWTDTERQYFYDHPFSLRSATLMLRGVRLYGNPSTAPDGTAIRNLSLALAYALGFGQNTSKWMAGDRIPFKAILDESRDNIFAILPAVGLFKRARTMLRMEREALTTYRTFTATRPFETEVSAWGFHSQNLPHLKRLFGKPLTHAEISHLGRIWTAVAREGEAVLLTAQNSRNLFDNQRRRFWRLVRQDGQARRFFEDAGFIFDGLDSTAPFKRLPDGSLMQLTIDHIVERQTSPIRALDPANLRISPRLENTVLLRLINKLDPFQ